MRSSVDAAGPHGFQGIRGKIFLHGSAVPLGHRDLRTAANRSQLDLLAERMRRRGAASVSISLDSAQPQNQTSGIPPFPFPGFSGAPSLWRPEEAAASRLTGWRFLRPERGSRPPVAETPR